VYGVWREPNDTRQYAIVRAPFPVQTTVAAAGIAAARRRARAADASGADFRFVSFRTQVKLLREIHQHGDGRREYSRTCRVAPG